MKIKEVIVVEGKNDSHRVKEAVEANTIETNGAGITQETMRLIKLAQEKCGIIILTDPDFTGNKIRERIQQEVPGCKHAYLPKSEAKPIKKNTNIGIEHASTSAIQQALANVHEVADVHISDICRSDLLTYGLIGAADAKDRRERLGAHLHIGYANAKQLLQRLRMFNITRCELKEAMMHILGRGSENN